VYARALRASGYGVAVLRQLSWHIRFDRRANAYRRYRWALPCSMSGLELTRRLRLHTSTTSVPIIVITSETRRPGGELSIKAGADTFLEKPVSGDALREKWYGYSWRAGVSVASCRRSTNVLVPYGRQRANVPAVSWTHGISAQLAGPLGGGSEQVASHDTGWAMCPVGFATTGGEYQELAWPMG